MNKEIIIFLAFLVIAFGGILITHILTQDREMTGHAHVTSHRVAQRSEMPRGDARWLGNWNYLVTFTLSDGEELELYTTETDFGTLLEGVSGQLTWQGKRFLNFEADT